MFTKSTEFSIILRGRKDPTRIGPGSSKNVRKQKIMENLKITA